MWLRTIFLVAFLAGPADADELKELETEHFAIYGVEDVPLEAMEMAGRQSERFYSSLAEMLGDAPSYRITVLLQGSAEQPDGTWGYPRVDGYGRIHLYQFGPELESYFGALAHEMVHVFRFHRRTNRDWFFEEGFAEFTALRVDPSLEGFPWYGYPVTVVAGQWFASERAIPLAVLRTRHEELNLPCKAQSYSLRSSFFDYLGRTYGDEKLVEMASWEGAGSDAHFKLIFGRGFDELASEWREALKKAYESTEDVVELTKGYWDSPAQYMPVCQEGVDF